SLKAQKYGLVQAGADSRRRQKKKMTSQAPPHLSSSYTHYELIYKCYLTILILSSRPLLHPGRIVFYIFETVPGQKRLCNRCPVATLAVDYNLLVLTNFI